MRTVLVVLVILTSLLSPVTVAAANEAPLADAGLDQSVPAGTTVYLDATGSRDPDGSVAGYEWIVEAPNGSTVLPDDFTDPRTSFVPTRTGRYEVTVIVTDDEGVNARDTLYVDVGSAPDRPDDPSDGPDTPTDNPGSGPPTDTPGEGPPPEPGTGDAVPTVPGGSSDAPLFAEIVGPFTVPAGTTAQFAVRASDPDGRIVSREWNTLGSRDSIATGSSSSERVELSFSEDDVGRTVLMTATVRNAEGDSVTVSKLVEVVPPDRERVLNLVGPSRVMEDETNTWRVRLYNIEAEVDRYKWNIGNGNGPAVSESWNIPNHKQSVRKEIISVTIILANGERVSDSKTVNIRQIQIAKEREIDQTSREGIQGVFREVRELLAGERKQTEVGPGSYYIETNSGEMEQANFVDPDTTIIDDYDPGALDVVSAGLGDLANRTSRAGGQLNAQITSGGIAVENQFDETASNVREGAETVGGNVDKALSRAGTAGDEAITSAGNKAGDTVGDVVETSIESSVLSEDNGPGDVGVSDSQAAEVGDVVEEGIQRTTDGVGDTYERGAQALGEGSSTVVEASGNAAGSIAEATGDAVQSGANFVGDRVEDASNAGSAVTGFLSDVASKADDAINEGLPGDDGEEAAEKESDSDSGGGWFSS